MNEPPVSRFEGLRRSFQNTARRIRSFVRSAVPFASGVLAALVALLLYSLLVPGSHQITKPEVNQAIAQAMASATVPPAYSASVFQVIQPSLVLIQTQAPAAAGKTENALGTGVIIDDQGDILTSLHVVANSTDIKLTFADGSQSSAQITVKQPENDIAVLQADNPPAKIIPATLGNP